jgi:hypothetical protein
VTCYSPYKDCDGVVSNGCESYTYDDAKNCGTCGHACAAGEHCSGGTCQSCPTGQAWCGYSCVDLSTSYSNCGACGAYCYSGGPGTIGVCSAGVCTSPCGSAYLDCDKLTSNGCEVTRTVDRNNCGACGVACGPDEICGGGQCAKCSPGLSVCNNACINLTTNNSNCGACGVSCSATAPHASAVCKSSACALQCSAGYLDCNGNALDGCEVQVSATNCGACGVTCGAGELCSKQATCIACSAVDLGSTVPQAVAGSTSGLTDVFTPSCGYSYSTPDVAYAFTAPAAGTYTFDTVGSSFGTVLEIRNGTCAGPKLGCASDSSYSGAGATVSVSLTAGQQVTVIVDGYSSYSGSYVLHIK